MSDQKAMFMFFGMIIAVILIIVMANGLVKGLAGTDKKVYLQNEAGENGI